MILLELNFKFKFGFIIMIIENYKINYRRRKNVDLLNVKVGFFENLFRVGVVCSYLKE